MVIKELLKNIHVIYLNSILRSKIEAQKIVEEFKKYSIPSTLTPINNLKKDATLAIVAGGDGSILKTARFYCDKYCYVFGVNLGRLGFLSQTNPNNIKNAVEKIVNGNFIKQNRLMIGVENTKLKALNDIVIKGDTISRTSRFFIKINNNVICDYLADGIIVSTPTGSTAYTLSAGGPVISPNVDALVIVPICPHTLAARPVVIPSFEKISISTCDICTNLNITSDGQESLKVGRSFDVVVSKSIYDAKLLVLNNNVDFYTILTNKLNWGKSPLINQEIEE